LKITGDGRFVPESTVMTSSDLIVVSSFRSQADAQKAKSVLDQAGIESVIRPDPSIVHWGPTQGKHFAESNAAQLMVKAEDADKAGEVLHGRHRRSN
jgi:hypothetical protein